LPKVHAAGQFAHHKDIKAIADQGWLQRTGICKGFVENGWAQVCIQPKVLSQWKQCTSLRAKVRIRDDIPFRSADSTEQNRICLAAKGKRFSGQWMPCRIVGTATDERLLCLDVWCD
jgi:hypothetical protein